MWLGDKLDEVAPGASGVSCKPLKSAYLYLETPWTYCLNPFISGVWATCLAEDDGSYLYRPTPLKILEMCNLNTLSLPDERSKLDYCSLYVVVKNHLKQGGYSRKGVEQSNGCWRKNWKLNEQRQKAFGLSSKCSPRMRSSGNDSCERQS